MLPTNKNSNVAKTNGAKNIKSNFNLSFNNSFNTSFATNNNGPE